VFDDVGSVQSSVQSPCLAKDHFCTVSDIKLRTEYFEALEVLEVVEATDLVSAVGMIFAGK
jgi:hypothetical protein